MPKIVFTPDEVNDFLKGKPEVNGCFYKHAIEMSDSIAVHADGRFPGALIEDRRPNEPIEVKNYRKTIFKPKTKPTFSKVYSSLQKIRRSQDWSIRYENSDQFARIAPGETLEEYCEANYPMFTSVTNWIFTLELRKRLIDPNAVVFIYPQQYDIPETEYIAPFSQVFDSSNVLYFEPEDYAILKIPEGCLYSQGRGKPVRGQSFYFITTAYIARYDQVSSRDYQVTTYFEHGLELLPVFKLKGVLVDQSQNQFLYESRIAGMIPELDEAVREYSDLQAGVVTSLYMERWEYTQNECNVCKGRGIVKNTSWTEDCGCAENLPCSASGCNNGYVVAGPYSKILVRPTNNAVEGQFNMPMPPAGYIEKDVEIIKLQDERVQKHIYDALSSINFEFLADTPLAQSGVAKETDRQELDNTVNSIAEDIVQLMDSMYRTIARYRYKNLYSMDEIEEMLPTINVPEKFDLLGSGVHATELAAAKTGKFNPVLQSALEVDYAGKRFNTEPEVRDELSLVLTLDPLANITDDDKMVRLSNKGITLETYIISSNIQAFIQRAMAEQTDFPSMQLSEQKAVLIKYAQEQVAAALDTLIPMEEQDPENNIYGQAV